MSSGFFQTNSNSSRISFQLFSKSLVQGKESLGKNVSGEYTDEVILMAKIGERLGI